MGFIVIETLNNLPYIFNWKSFIGSEAKTSWKFAVIGQKGTLFGEETVEKFSHLWNGSQSINEVYVVLF